MFAARHSLLAARCSLLATRCSLLAVIAVTLGGATACASLRGAEVRSEPGPAYVIEVTNSASYDMRVSYDDGAGSRLLGLVPAGRTQQFVITSPARLTVTIRATDENGGRDIQRSVTLLAGTTSRVVLNG